MTEQERILQEITECTNEIESLIAQKSVLDIQAGTKRAELKVIEEEVALLQSSLIKENSKMQELNVVKNWLSQEGEIK